MPCLQIFLCHPKSLGVEAKAVGTNGVHGVQGIARRDLVHLEAVEQPVDINLTECDPRHEAIPTQVVQAVGVEGL